MKRLFSWLLVFSFICALPITSLAASKSEDKEGYSMKEIQGYVLSYLEENYPDIQIGTPEFYDFTLEQLLGNTNENLLQNKNYELIRVYLSEYKIL